MLEKVIVEDKKVVSDSVIIWLHGLGADGHDFESIVPELKLPETLRVRFVFPHAPVRKVTVNGGYAMRAWYDIAEEAIERRPDEKGMLQSVAQIQELIDFEIKSGISADKILIAGFSQGGAIALLLGLGSVLRLGGIMALSTYLPNIPLQNQTNKEISYLMMHGNSDPIVPMTLATQSYEKLKALGLQADWQSYAMGHSLCLEQIADISAWIKAKLT